MWQLKQRLRIAVLGVPLALAGCEKRPRQVVAPDAAGVLVLARTADAALDGGEAPGLDAALALAIDAAALPVPIATAPEPKLAPNASGQWCAPPKQANKKRSVPENFKGCAMVLVQPHGPDHFLFRIDRSRTKARQAAGELACCYDWRRRVDVVDGRPLVDRGIARKAPAVRVATPRWG